MMPECTGCPAMRRCWLSAIGKGPLLCGADGSPAQVERPAVNRTYRRANPTRDGCLRLLGQRGAATAGELASELGQDRTHVNYTLTQLIDERLVVRHEREHEARRTYEYRLAQ